MSKKITIAEPALRVKKTDRIIKAPSKAWAHDQIEAKHHLPDKKVKRGFVTNEGDFVGRKKAAKIADAAGELKKPVKKLHSTDLRLGAGIKKKVLK